MRVKREIMTVLAITRMYEDKACIAGVNKDGKWLRIRDLYLRDLGDLKTKIYDETEFFFLDGETNHRRPEDLTVFLDDGRKPQFIRELQGDERLRLIEKNLDSSVKEIFEQERTLGLIKPIIENIEFRWDAYINDFIARFTFKDQKGIRYDFPCLDIFWRKYWTNFYRLKNEELKNQLLNMQWTLNDQETFFVVGLTHPFPEMPGPIEGCWPLILGVHTLSVPDYIKDYNT